MAAPAIPTGLTYGRVDFREPAPQQNERRHLQNVSEHRAEHRHVQQHRADRAGLSGELNRQRGREAQRRPGHQRAMRRLRVCHASPKASVGKYPARDSE